MSDTPANYRLVEWCKAPLVYAVLPGPSCKLGFAFHLLGAHAPTDAPYREADRARSLRAVLHIHVSILHQQLAKLVLLGASRLQRCFFWTGADSQGVWVCARARGARCGCPRAWLSDAGHVRRRMRGDHCMQARRPRPRADDTQGLHRDAGSPKGFPQKGHR